MSFTNEKRQEIINAILEEINKSNISPVKKIAEQFNISRQTVHRYLINLVSKGIIEVSGKNLHKTYTLHKQEINFTLLIEGLEEDVVWEEKVLPFLPNDLPPNVLNACHYVFTEILNNAIDHSESKDVFILVRQDAINIEFTIWDKGIGIFNKIQMALGLKDPKHSILELAKGKFTTDPSKHSGEGIFFSSRVFDLFHIYSGNLSFISGRKGKWDILFDDKDNFNGTCMIMTIAKKSDVVVREVFDEYTDSESYGFTKTYIPVKLVDYEGISLVSRSQAKRLIMRFNKFKEVILDFNGVDEVGQAFADELFRVFANSHPDVELFPIYMNENVKKMVQRALAH